ncbi:c-type cytochrome [Motiliproteus sp.]|uniref:c-type cytochrome n=1 Tax=Motiliproteus sp. TaxID=1898955 RepID=UPI003BA8F9F4
MASKTPLLCISAVTALLMVGCGEDKQVASTPAATPKPATQAAPQPEPAKPVVEQVKEDMSNAVEAATDTAKQMSDKAEQMADDIKEQAADTMEKAEDKAAEMVASVSEKVAPAAASGESTYKSLCFSCHDTGLAGAPKLGDKAAWEPRLATGIEAIYNTAINGRGAMPAKGGNPALSDADVKATVDYMLSTVN